MAEASPDGIRFLMEFDLERWPGSGVGDFVVRRCCGVGMRCSRGAVQGGEMAGCYFGYVECIWKNVFASTIAANQLYLKVEPPPTANGRKFGGNPVMAVFYLEDKFAHGAGKKKKRHIHCHQTLHIVESLDLAPYDKQATSEQNSLKEMKNQYLIYTGTFLRAFLGLC
ncbi:uncharacterized protein LOC133724333 [Rosa rugosa]|nr:uncharacterized protein LOC133724333 [Rosa rugosa]XP_062007012.1 uncharacterized protein LOC133724333 [Rosa rugosa]